MPRPHRRQVFGIVVGTMAAAAIACGSAEPRATPEGTGGVPARRTQSQRIFASARHRYTVEMPAGWDVTEYPGTWNRLEQFSPGAEVPGEDVLLSPDGSAFLVANSMPIPEGTTAAAWLEAFDALVTKGLDPRCPGTNRKDVFAGEPATIVTQRCEGSVIVGRSLTHGGRGYYFTTRSPEDDPALEAEVRDLIASIRFLDD